MNDELYNEVYDEALKLFREYQSRPKGQQITNKDNFDYWLVMVAYNEGFDDGCYSFSFNTGIRGEPQ